MKKRIKTKMRAVLFAAVIFTGIFMVSCFDSGSGYTLYISPDVPVAIFDSEGLPVGDDGTYVYMVKTPDPGGWDFTVSGDGTEWLKVEKLDNLLILEPEKNIGAARGATVIITSGTDLSRQLPVVQHAAPASNDYITLDPEPENDNITLDPMGYVHGTVDPPMFTVTSSPEDWSVSQTSGMSAYFNVEKDGDLLRIGVIGSADPDAGTRTTTVTVTAGTAKKDITVNWIQQ